MVIVAGMKAASPMLVQILLAAFLAVVTSPLFFFLQKLGLRPWIALLIIIMLLVLGGFFTVGIIGNSVASFTENLPLYQKRVQVHLVDLFNWLESKGLEVPDGTARDDGTAPDILDTQVVFGFARTTFGAVSNMLGQGVIIVLIAAFFLLEAAMLPRKVQAAVGPDGGDTWQHVSMGLVNVRHYMGIKTLICLLTGFLVWGMAFAFQLDYAFLLGVLAFALNYIPSIGSFMAAIPGIILALVQFGPGRAVWVGVVYTVINVAIGNVLEPRVVGKGLGLSPAIILISLVFWGWVLGPIGMLLSVPLTMTVKIALQGIEETRGIALLLGSSVPNDALAPQHVDAPAEPAETQATSG